jgi:hypothetical protein
VLAPTESRVRECLDRRGTLHLASALRPGGQLAIVDFTQEATHGPPPAHRLSPETIIADLRGVGLDAVVSPTQLPDQFIVIGTRR